MEKKKNNNNAISEGDLYLCIFLSTVTSLLQMADKLVSQTQLDASTDWRITSAPSSTSFSSLYTNAHTHSPPPPLLHPVCVSLSFCNGGLPDRQSTDRPTAVQQKHTKKCTSGFFLQNTRPLLVDSRISRPSRLTRQIVYPVNSLLSRRRISVNLLIAADFFLKTCLIV